MTSASQTQQQEERIIKAKQTLDTLHEISLLLNCGLDKETLSLCTSLCENGVNPEALAQVIKELKGQKYKLQQQK